MDILESIFGPLRVNFGSLRVNSGPLIVDFYLWKVNLCSGFRILVYIQKSRVSPYGEVILEHFPRGPIGLRALFHLMLCFFVIFPNIRTPRTIFEGFG